MEYLFWLLFSDHVSSQLADYAMHWFVSFECNISLSYLVVTRNIYMYPGRCVIFIMSVIWKPCIKLATSLHTSGTEKPWSLAHRQILRLEHLTVLGVKDDREEGEKEGRRVKEVKSHHGDEREWEEVKGRVWGSKFRLRIHLSCRLRTDVRRTKHFCHSLLE